MSLPSNFSDIPSSQHDRQERVARLARAIYVALDAQQSPHYERGVAIVGADIGVIEISGTLDLIQLAEALFGRIS